MKSLDNLLPVFKLNKLSLHRTWADELNEKFIKQLMKLSKQPHIMEHEAEEDAGGRFKSVEDFKKWASKGRLVYLLLHENMDIGGIIWFGKRTNPEISTDYGITFGIRLYESCVGKGLAKPFMKITHTDMVDYFEQRYIWLDYLEGNVVAGKVYSGYGYYELGKSKNRVIMGMALPVLKDKKIVVLGGGNGTGVVMSALKSSGADLTAILSMSDDGGSTGELRKTKGVSAVGDIRHCLSALVDKEEVRHMLEYRFADGNLEGHSLGNLVLATAEKANGGIKKAIDSLREVLSVEQKILPVTLDNPLLTTVTKTKKIKGVYKTAKTKLDGKSSEFRLEPKANIDIDAKSAIDSADLIILAPGNFYCSIVPVLLVGGVIETIASSKAKVVFTCNLVNFNNHCRGYRLEDYLSEIRRITDRSFIDIVVANSQTTKIKIKDELVEINKEDLGVKVLRDELISSEKITPNPNDKISNIRSTVRHDKQVLNKLVTQILLG